MVRVWVNFYGSTSTSGADAELRFTIDGRTYTRAIHIAAMQGDGGAGGSIVIEDGELRGNWLTLDLLDLIGD